MIPVVFLNCKQINRCLLFALPGVDDADGAVVADPSQRVSGWRESHAVNPAATVFMLQKHFTERHLGSPWRRPRLVLDFLDICGEDPAKSEL